MKDRCKTVTFDRLVDYYEGVTDAATTEHIRMHLADGCAVCRGQLAWLQRFLPVLRAVLSTEAIQAPAPVLARAYSLFRERAAEVSKPSLPVLIARLLFDSRRAPAPSGARGENRSDCQVVYSTGAHDVDLWQEQLDAGNWYLIGQVLPKEGEDAITPGEIVLTGRDGSRLLGTAGEGEFYVRSAPAGAYEVRLRLSEAEIVLPDVMVGR